MGTAIHLTIPAGAEHVALARSTAATAAAHADLTLDQIEDVRLAVDEAVSQLLAGAPPASSIACEFVYSDGSLDVRIAGPTATGAMPDQDSFGWTVLTALTHSASAEESDGVVTISLRVARSATAPR